MQRRHSEKGLRYQIAITSVLSGRCTTSPARHPIKISRRGMVVPSARNFNIDCGKCRSSKSYRSNLATFDARAKRPNAKPRVGYRDSSQPPARMRIDLSSKNKRKKVRNRIILPNGRASRIRIRFSLRLQRWIHRNQVMSHQFGALCVVDTGRRHFLAQIEPRAFRSFRILSARYLPRQRMPDCLLRLVRCCAQQKPNAKQCERACKSRPD